MYQRLFGGVVLWAILVIASTLLLRHPVFLQYLFLLRVPLLIGGLLVALPILANNLLKSLLQNLFVLHDRVEFALVTIAALFTGMGIASVTNTLLVDGADRFNLPKLEWVNSLLFHQWVFAVILGLSTIIIAIFLSIPEIKRLPRRSAAIEIPLGIGSGGLIAYLLFSFGNFFTTSLEGFEPFKQLLVFLISLLPEPARRGYLDLNTGNLTAGHLSAIGFLAAVMVIYIPLFFYGMWLYKPELIPSWARLFSRLCDGLTQNRKRSFEVPALFYLLTIFLLLVLLLGGLTFLLDFFRVPLLIVLVLVSLTAYWLFNVNHYYELSHSSQSGFATNGFVEILNRRFQQWEETYGNDYPNYSRTLVVICPAGGGIQAAGWTARVLTGLYEHPDLGKPFVDAIGLISSVSGGSIGSMYFLDALANGMLDARLKRVTPESPNAIVRSATVDGLDAIGWGLAYPDLWRVIGLPFLSHPNLDRGVALEADWTRVLSDPANAPTLASWSKRIEAGVIPIPVFNATIVEDGSRLTISPLPFQEEERGVRSKKQFKDFRTLYENFDLPITTAARLSATFPYVSPICRNDSDVPQKNFHVADGGYFDNFGVFTAIQWLNQSVLPYSATGEKPLNIKRVLLVEIRSFPEPIDPEAAKTTDRGGMKEQWRRRRGEENLDKPGWKMTILGPLLTLFNVRNYTQAARNEVEIQGLKQLWNNDRNNIDIQHHIIEFPQLDDLSAPPLSWKLSEKQKADIDAAWNKTLTSYPFSELVNAWNRKDA
jgi:hypothetical protein